MGPYNELYSKYMLKAYEISYQSNAKKRQVGAVLVENLVFANDTHGTILGTGYNTMFEQLGTASCENMLGDSFECVIHAEEAAIMNALKSNSIDTLRKINTTLFVTFTPCMNCCKLIAHVGIKRVVYSRAHVTNFDNPEILEGFSPKEFLEKMGIIVEQYSCSEIEHPTGKKEPASDNEPIIDNSFILTDSEDELVQKNSENNALQDNVDNLSKTIDNEICERLIFDKPTKKKIALIYHSADPDGLMCQYLFTKYLKPHLLGQNDGDDYTVSEVVLIPYNYEDTADWMKSESNFTHYYFADVTPPYEWLEETFSTNDMQQVMIFDHHKPKMMEIINNKIGWIFNQNLMLFFDEKESGCSILYEYLVNNSIVNLNDNVKTIVDLISIYDTWQFDAPQYQRVDDLINKHSVLAFTNYLFVFCEVQNFNAIMDLLLVQPKHNPEWSFEKTLHSMFSDGNVIVEKIKLDNISLIKNGKYHTDDNVIEEKIKLDNISLIKNGKYHTDDNVMAFIFQGYPNYWIEDQIREKFPTVEVFVGYRINLVNDEIKFSLRSRKLDVQQIAAKHGGGGHKNASAFKTSLKCGFDLISKDTCLIF